MFFEFVNNLMNAILGSVEGLFNFFLAVQVKIGNFILLVLATIFKSILHLIDHNRVHHAEQAISQQSLSNELEILIAVSKVKEDAIDHSAWTPDHSLALNSLSQKLYDECDWELHRIHDYMRNIVESIPGLSYVAAEDEDDEDDGTIKLGD